MNIEICVYNLGTGATTYGSISNREEWSELETKVNPLGWNDVETQVMSSDLSSPINDNNLHYFIDLIEEYPQEDEDKISDLLYYCDNEIASEVLRLELPCIRINATSENAAFMEYYEMLGYEMPPERWEYCIDWDKIKELFIENGLSISYIGSCKNGYEWLFVQTW